MIFAILLFGSLLQSRAAVVLALHDYGFFAEPIRFETNFFDFRLNNMGNESLRGIVRGDLYLSVDGALDASDRLLSQVDQSFNQFPLNPGGQTVIRFNVQIPDARPGPYWVIMNLKGGDPAVSEQYAGPFQILAPDFVVEDLGAMTPIRVFEPLQVTWVLKNSGNGTSKGMNSQRLYFSKDSVLSGDDMFITNVARAAQLGKNFADRVITPSTPMPADPRGGYFLVQVDADNQISELDEQNNVFAFRIPPQKELTIAQEENAITLSWEATYGNQTVETSELVFPPRWTALTVAGVRFGDVYTVRLAKPEESRLYRIK